MATKDPAGFHPVHADSIHVSPDGATATLTHSKQEHVYGITFSARNIEYNEIVYLRLKPGQSPSGLIWGVTNTDPAILSAYRNRELFLNQDLFVRTNSGIRIMTETITKEETLYFYVNNVGKIRFWFSGNRDKMETLLLAVDARKPMWVVLEIWGQDTSVEYVKAPKNAKILEDECGSFYDYNNVCWRTKEFLPSSIFRMPLIPLDIHDFDYFLSRQIIFSARPIRPGQIIVLADWEDSGRLDIGVTSNDPSSFGSNNKPDLFQKPNSWDVIREAAKYLKENDALALTVTEGKIHVIKKQSKESDKVEKDLEIQSSKLWMFVIVNRHSKVKILTTPMNLVKKEKSLFPPLKQKMTPRPAPRVPPSQRQSDASFYQNVLPSTSSASPKAQPRQNTSSLNALNQRHMPEPSAPPEEPAASPALSYEQYKTKMNEIGKLKQIADKGDEPLSPKQIIQKFSQIQISAASSTNNNKKQEEKKDSECIVCCENKIDSVLNPCGHMHMCHQCATRQLEIKGECPMCRAKIVSVIRIYK